MASKEKVKRKKAEKTPKLSFAKKKSKKSAKQLEAEVVQEDPAGSQVSVRSATKDNIKDNTEQDPEFVLDHSSRDEEITFTPQSSERPRSSTSEMKKTKSDHIDQKLDAEDKDASLTPGDPQTRTPSPFRKNVVSPKSGEKEAKVNMGSAVSLKSNTSYSSLKEAWVEKKDDQREVSKTKKKKNETTVTNLTVPSIPSVRLSQAQRKAPSLKSSSSSASSLREAAAVTSKTDGLKGVKVEVDEDSPEKHAYIPYLYARNCIAKIMEDMKQQKNSHVLIVENIQTHYRTIEDETQQQFNMFILCMRQDYADKRKAFRQIIDVHKTELEEKERYWNEMLTSLAERNNKLLREKKVILTTNKIEIEKLEKEKSDLNRELRDKMDRMALMPSPDGSQDDTEQVVEINDKQVLAGIQNGTMQVTEETNKEVKAGSQKTGTKHVTDGAKKEVKAGNQKTGTKHETEAAVEEVKVGAQAGTKQVTKNVDKRPGAKQAVERPDKKVEPVPNDTMTRWEEEKKILQDELESEKAKVTRLEEQIVNANMTPVEPKVETATVEARESTVAPAGGLIAAGAIAMTKENNKELEKERKDMEEERMQLDEERKQFHEEREGFGGERKKWLDEINKLQSQLGEKEVSDTEWKVKYETLKERLDDAADAQAKYKALEVQYAALAALVKDSDTTNAVQEQLEKTKGEKVMMEEEKQNMEKDIEKWEKDFEKENKRKPTEEDKSDSVKEMYTTHSELEYMVTSLEKKEETLSQVESGKIPDPPVVSQTPVDTKEPEVVTVQVKVPDPEIVKELEKSHEEITIVRTEIITLQETITTLRTEISHQKEELAKQRSRIAELEAENAVLKAGGSTGTTVAPLTLPGSSVSEEELEKLKKENRELRKDMKKMIKQYTRLAERKKETGEDEDPADHQKDLDEQIGVLDNKVADLEAENEALKEERTILKERVRTITETITITQTRGEGDKKILEEKDNKIEELRQEIEKLKTEKIAMHKDMKKMVKSFEKLKTKYDDIAGSEKAVRMLEIVAMLIHEIHGEVPDAAVKVNIRLEDYEDQMAVSSKILESRQQAYTQWVDRYSQKYGKEPLKTDRPLTPQLQKAALSKFYKRDKEGQQLAEGWDTAKKDFKEKALHLAAIQLIKTGDMTKVVDKQGLVSEKAEFEVEHLEKQLSSADNKLIELESEKDTIKQQKDQLQERNQDLENQLEELRKQMEMQSAVLADSDSSAELTQQIGEIQKKADTLQAELMQEKMSHVNTRDELEGLHKQLSIVKEEAAHEKEEAEAAMASNKATQEAEKHALNDEIKTLKDRAEALEAERLSNMPPDTAKEIKELQDKLKTLEQEKTSSRTSSVTLNAQISELSTKLEVASKNLETQRAHNRELEAKLKSGRIDKEKEAKKMSRHMEETQQKRTQEDKQRINMLVKRVKELEAKVGKGMAVIPGGAAGGQVSDAQAATLKRELAEQATRIKQLEADLKDATRSGTAGAMSADKSKSKQEKILKELEKKLTWEKDKADKLIEGLKSADEENKGLKKEVEEKNKDLVKVKMELKTLGVAAKEGIEAATKVKNLEVENKKLGEENVTLTKNFESERVLRKKYYNMVEDMKGKIRVYCRSRPLSSDEMSRGNKAVVKSIDEYTISVAGQRGLKEFQYDQVFMEDSTQERIFEDTNNLIQSAVDGYNVCIFAYGQTGSGKTFTMIGDREQKYPGIAPRAFNRIFELIHELRNKFKITVQAYMLELYNDKLIDLFAKPGLSDDDKLEIKKDKKGMVFIQGAVVKDAKNAKELFALFEEGSINRHTASTKMNAESSRSHLIIGIVMESTNKNTGNVTKGKLSLVDLAGSERVAKTGATADQLKEAMSINKSLSALGDVISALSSEQQFIPYRNHKLTMLMQDSLGGNAKTLMFVNISPADYNADESVISLTYASRVKLITNDASKNADNKEIARLKSVIEKMKKGEQVQDADEEA